MSKTATWFYVKDFRFQIRSVVSYNLTIVFNIWTQGLFMNEFLLKRTIFMICALSFKIFRKIAFELRIVKVFKWYMITGNRYSAKFFIECTLLKNTSKPHSNLLHFMMRRLLLSHCKSLVSFYTPLKHQKGKGFFILSGA